MTKKKEEAAQPPIDELLTIDETAELLRCTRQTVTRMLKRGELTRIVISRQMVRIPKASVQKFLRERTDAQPDGAE